MALTKANQATQSNTIKGRTSQFSLSSHGNYNINNLSYPTGVSSDPDKLHYVCFFINMRGKSQIFANDNLDPKMGQSATTSENRLDPTKMGRAAVLGGAAMGGLAGLSLGKTAGKAVYAAGGKSNLAATAVQVVGGAAVAVLGAAVADFAVRPDTTYRISDVITLHLPHAPKVSYGASYADIELGAGIGALSGGSSAVDATKEGISVEAMKATVLAASAVGAGKAAAIMTAKFGGAPVSGEQVTAATQLAEGQSINPFREVLFKNMSFRRHSFNYTFMPKSKDESDNIFNILKTFRYHMHPELSSGSLYMIHPSEFVIQLYFDGNENTNFPKMATCALETCDIQYGDGTRFSSFYDGSATEISMNLVFRELSSLTKADINNGY
jgi:hypothetical protein